MNKIDYLQILNTETGEIIPKNKIKKELKENLVDTFNDYNGKLHEIGINSGMYILEHRGKEYPVGYVKQNYMFRKVYAVDVRFLMENAKLSKNALVFIAYYQSFIYYPTNSVVINGKNPSIKDICEQLEMKKSSVYTMLNELEENEVIKRQKLNGALIIYFNPFLYASGTVICNNTIGLFIDSIYNPKNNKQVTHED